MSTPAAPRVNGLCFGGDYNPEQWPEHVWAEDVALMREAGVTLVSLGIFSWAWLEPAEGRYEFGWLDRIMDLLHEGGIKVDLATATAAPPPWFSLRYPESLPVDANGVRLIWGSRQAYCPSSVAYREGAKRLTRALAERYARHPALAMWHVNNEYACHVAFCYCDASAAAFRVWLRARYGDLDKLNEAWGTAFWSQRYTDWAEVMPPRATPTWHNPTQVLDFKRFSSDALLELFTAERDILHSVAPGTPVTTNFMTGGGFDKLDYWAWAREIPLISTDHYVIGVSPQTPAEQIAFSADFTRGLAGGAPWLLMEHSPGAVNWQPVNLAREPGRMLRDALGHVARGSDGVMFFQWRASRAGAEKWHAGMVPHAGIDTPHWREVVGLGEALRNLAPVAGCTVTADLAIVLDFDSIWAQEAPPQPSRLMTAFAEIRRWHAAAWRLGATIDVVSPGSDLSRYRAVLVPSLYLLADGGVGALESYVEDGGTLVVGPYAAAVDEHDHVALHRLNRLLGHRLLEFAPLLEGQTVSLSGGYTGHTWAESRETVDAATEIIASFADGPASGRPAMTRRGGVWWLGTRLAEPSLESFLTGVFAQAGISVYDGPGTTGVERVIRQSADGSAYLFLLNHGDDPTAVDAQGVDLLTGATFTGHLAAGGVAVIRLTAEEKN